MTRRHHNTTGERQIRRGKTRTQVEHMAKRLGVPYGSPQADERAADSSSSALDPRLLAYAEEAVRDLVSEMGREALAGRKDALVQRLAKAMQQAIDDEYVALAQELDTRAGGPDVYPSSPYRVAEGS